jgi:hypothetical protein
MRTNHDSLAIDIDAAIDEVAREMTAAAPTTDLRARVMSRLEDRRSRSIWRWMPLLTVAASVVIAVGAWALWPPASRPVATNVTPGVATIAAAPARTAPDTRATTTVEPRAHVERVRTSQPPAEPRMTEVETAWHAWNERAVPALSGPSALTIDSLDHSGVSIAPIDIRPLVTEPLTIRSIGGAETLK